MNCNDKNMSIIFFFRSLKKDVKGIFFFNFKASHGPH